MPELICPKHGHYDASYGQCPICSGAELPGPPRGLNEDDMPTDLGGGDGGYDDDPTEIGMGGSDTSLPTEIAHGNGADETEIDFIDDSIVAILWVKDGDRRGKIYPVKDGYVVGREDQNIVLDDRKVSNVHARFRLEDEGFELWDFGSKNGTFVNGERIKAATLIKENDTIKFGDTTFVLKTLD